MNTKNVKLARIFADLRVLDITQDDIVRKLQQKGFIIDKSRLSQLINQDKPIYKRNKDMNKSLQDQLCFLFIGLLGKPFKPEEIWEQSQQENGV